MGINGLSTDRDTRGSDKHLQWFRFSIRTALNYGTLVSLLRLSVIQSSRDCLNKVTDRRSQVKVAAQIMWRLVLYYITNVSLNSQK